MVAKNKNLTKIYKNTKMILLQKKSKIEKEEEKSKKKVKVLFDFFDF